MMLRLAPLLLLYGCSYAFMADVGASKGTAHLETVPTTNGGRPTSATGDTPVQSVRGDAEFFVHFVDSPFGVGVRYGGFQASDAKPTPGMPAKWSDGGTYVDWSVGHSHADEAYYLRYGIEGGTRNTDFGVGYVVTDDPLTHVKGVTFTPTLRSRGTFIEIFGARNTSPLGKSDTQEIGSTSYGVKVGRYFDYGPCYLSGPFLCKKN